MHCFGRGGFAASVLVQLGVTVLLGCSDGSSSGDSTSGGAAGNASSGGSTQAGGASSGGAVSSGGAQSTGGAGAGGSSTAGSSSAGSSAGGSGGGVFTPPTCSADSSMELPAEAPELELGVWKNISPPAKFNDAPGNFTQGMTIDPCNPATLYACVVGFDAGVTANNGLYRTTDAGSSWTRLGDQDFPVRVRVDPEDPNHLYAVNGVNGTTHGFWVSTDGGETWKVPDAFKELAESELIFDAYHVEPDPTDFNHVLVTFHNGWKDAKYGGNSGIIESFDGGESFTVHPPVNDSWAGGYNVFFLFEPELGIGDANTWLFGTQGDGYYRTTNAGETWDQVTTVDMDHGGGSLYYTADGILYASGAPSLLRSEDNGETWTETVPAQFTAFLTVVGDGQKLYALPHFGGSVKTAPEDTADPWLPLGNDPTEFQTAGAFEMVVDSHNHILYNASTGAGVWALKFE